MSDSSIDMSGSSRHQSLETIVDVHRSDKRLKAKYESCSSKAMFITHQEEKTHGLQIKKIISISFRCKKIRKVDPKLKTAA